MMFMFAGCAADFPFGAGRGIPGDSFYNYTGPPVADYTIIVMFTFYSYLPAVLRSEPGRQVGSFDNLCCLNSIKSMA